MRPLGVMPWPPSHRPRPCLLAYYGMSKPARVMVAPYGAGGWRLDDRMGWEILVGSYLEPVESPAEDVRVRLASYQRYGSCAARIGSVLSIVEACRPWLSDVCTRHLAEAAYNRNDAIDQMAEGYGGRVLPDEVRRAAGDEQAADMVAISAFVLACAAHALQALMPILAGERGAADDWERHRIFLESVGAVRDCAVHGCTAMNSAALSESEIDACFHIADLADAAALTAARSANGYWGADGYHRLGGVMIEGRRQLDGTDARDEAIRLKALELIDGGTKLHNLSSKLRKWQLLEAGQALSKPAMNAILKRLKIHH